MANVWIFQGSPDLFQMDNYVSQNKEITWLVNQKHLASKMAIGDLVYLWRAGGKGRKESGIIATARISSLPEISEDDDQSKALWKLEQNDGKKLRVNLTVEYVAKKIEIIDRNWLLDDPILKDLLILKLAQNTNYLVPKSKESRLKKLWDRTGVDWTKEESIAGLWAYAQLIRQPVSKTEDSLVSKLSVLIGRAVTGTYAKVLNVKSLDPNAQGGLQSVSNMDRQVWNEFYDENTKALKIESLNQKFKELWGGIEEEVEISEEEIQEALPKTTENQKDGKKQNGTYGQSYVKDSKLKRAIELRAVELATDYYIANDFEVTDTGATESFDLRCMKKGVERRTEVKGTTTEGVTVILTRGEVEHARKGSTPVDLIIVHSIKIYRSPDGPMANGGIFSIVENWTPKEEDLTIATYSYKTRLNSK